jgi:flagellar biosynthetic protein FliO
MDLIEQLGPVAGVLVLLAATLWWLRRRGCAAGSPRRSRRRLESLERLPLGPHHSVHLVRLGGKVMVVACSPGGCTLLPLEDGPGSRGEVQP